MAEKLTTQLQDLGPAIEAPLVSSHNKHTFWKYCLRVDGARVREGAVGMARLLKARGIASAPRYIGKPAFACQVFREQRTFGSSRFPFTLARPEAVDYSAERFPGVYGALEGVLVLPWNECYTDEHVDYLATAIRDAHQELAVR
jgi:dTDP-4-amino-4,6-dideoxygalactose transaminase